MIPTEYWSIISFVLLTFTNMAAQPPAFCDPATGLCTPAPLTNNEESIEWREDVEIIYVGDPMCSWCWGISPQLNQLKRKAEETGIPYRIVLGGLRPGGGDPWNDQFKEFLQHHWEEVNERSGQPFGYSLFDLEEFNYDTEPSCRAVVVARQIAPEMEERFFELVQHHFYVQNKDPKEAEFYQPICKELGIDFEAFETSFHSIEAQQLTQMDFQLNRQWGVRGFPTVIYKDGTTLYAVATGFATFDQMWEQIEQLID